MLYHVDIEQEVAVRKVRSRSEVPMKIFDKIILVLGTIWFIWALGTVIESAAEGFCKPGYSYTGYSSYSSSDHSGSTYSSGSSYSSGRNYLYDGKAAPTPTPTPASAYRSHSSSNSNKSGSSDSRTYRDPDDYMDVESYYYDNRSDFESEDDAWDYLDDEWDEWD